ncbi:LamG-like jellyroll fold domain-containing protein [Streptomyces sp. NPDC006274]|uniref:LamG-like jellyroll fold domain-containing protein n=1 Tax=unclassified Streptomyces TaxID=2593676 RepID=UPI00339DE8BA
MREPEPGAAAEDGTGALCVGRARWSGQNVDFWHGAIDQVRACDRALTAEEVSALRTEEQPRS